MTSGSEQNRIRWVYSSVSNQDLQERYDQWAGDYEADLDRDFGWVCPDETASLVVKYVKRETRILDAGVGTGVMGEKLARLGYGNLMGIDLSPGMLAEAEKKKVYLGLSQMTLGEYLEFPDDYFGAVVSVGVFTTGHAPASSMHELVRITRPGGHIIFSLPVNVYNDTGFMELQEELSASGRWRLLEATHEFPGLPRGEPDVMHQIWAYEIEELS